MQCIQSGWLTSFKYMELVVDGIGFDLYVCISTCVYTKIPYVFSSFSSMAFIMRSRILTPIMQ